MCYLPWSTWATVKYMCLCVCKLSQRLKHSAKLSSHQDLKKILVTENTTTSNKRSLYMYYLPRSNRATVKYVYICMNVCLLWQSFKHSAILSTANQICQNYSIRKIRQQVKQVLCKYITYHEVYGRPQSLCVYMFVVDSRV